MRSAARQFARIGCLLTLVLWADALPAAAKPPSASEKIYQRCQAACVEVLVNGHHSGSGWFARADGLVVTASHLFERRDAEVEVMSPGRGRLACSLLAVDRGHDIALLKTKAPGRDFPVLGFSCRHFSRRKEGPTDQRIARNHTSQAARRAAPAHAVACRYD